jgi:hypothetical protein
MTHSFIHPEAQEGGSEEKPTKFKHDQCIQAFPNIFDIQQQFLGSVVFFRQCGLDLKDCPAAMYMVKYAISAVCGRSPPCSLHLLLLKKMQTCRRPKRSPQNASIQKRFLQPNATCSLSDRMANRVGVSEHVSKVEDCYFVLSLPSGSESSFRCQNPKNARLPGRLPTESRGPPSFTSTLPLLPLSS